MIGSKLGIFSQAAGGEQFAFGNALKFDGVDDYLNEPTDSVLYDTANYFTVSFWFYLDGNISSFLHFMNLKTTIGQAMAITTAATSRGAYSGIGVNFSSNSIGFGDQTQPIPNQWNHLAITGLKTNSASTGFICILNGVTLTNRTGGGYGSMPNTTRIGYASNNLYKSPVTLDEIAYYDNYQASTSELLSFYNNGLGQLATDVIPSPKFYLRLNESGTDTTAVDDSNNNLNFDLNNFPASGMWVQHGDFDPLSINWDIYYNTDNVNLSGSSITSFADLSGNLNDCTQSTTANQGTLTSIDSQYNNLSTATVTGTDFYDLTTNITINRNGDRTIWWIGNNIVTASTFEFLYSSATFSYIGYVRAAGLINFVGNGAQWAGLTAVNITAPLINVITFTANGKMRYYQNGSLINTSTADLNVSGSYTANRMFGQRSGSALNAKFHQFSSVERLLNTSELNYLGDGFAQQLGITWTPIV